jgi:ribonuclease HI
MKDTNTLFLFTDGSVNTKINFGYGAYLAVTETEIQPGIPEQLVKVKRFEETSSVKLELQTMLWALNETRNFIGKIILYTDSQNIIGLPGRRERLEKNDFRSKQNRRIANWELYKEFYQLTDKLNFELLKVTGHKRTSSKDNIDRLFTIVDRASRKAVREENGF